MACARGLGWCERGQAVEPAVELVERQRRERRLAGRGREGRQPPPDARRQADRLAPVVAGQVGHLEPVEDRELDRLLGAPPAAGARRRRTPGPGRPSRGRRRRARPAGARARTRSRCAARGPASASAPQMLAIDDFGRPSRRASSLGPTASVADSARTSRISAARVTAGARDSGSASRSTVVSVIGLRFLVIEPPGGRRPPASRMDRVQHIDLRSRRSPYCSTYRRSFSMLDAQGGGQEEESACRGSNRSRPRSAWFSCWRPAQASPPSPSPAASAAAPSAPAPASAAAPSEPRLG